MKGSRGLCLASISMATLMGACAIEQDAADLILVNGSFYTANLPPGVPAKSFLAATCRLSLYSGHYSEPTNLVSRNDVCAGSIREDAMHYGNPGNNLPLMQNAVSNNKRSRLL